MRIQILYGYRGHRTNEQFLAPGVHEVEAEFGAYLIANGHARPVDVAAVEPAAPVAPVEVVDVVEVVEPIEAPQAVTTDFAAFTFAELKELAELAGLEVVGTGKNGAILKADFVRALEGAEA